MWAPRAFKIKPEITLDLAIIGYTTRTADTVTARSGHSCWPCAPKTTATPWLEPVEISSQASTEAAC